MANERTYAAGTLPAMVPVSQTVTGDFIPFKAGQIPGLDIPAHDYIVMTYNGSDLTRVEYKTGGSGGTTVATLILTYTGGNLTSVAKT